MTPSVVMEAVNVDKDTIDSDDSEEDNIPIAQTRKKEKVTIVVEKDVSSEDETVMPETGVRDWEGSYETV